MKYKDIEFLRITPLRGPNIWTYRPIIEAWVDIGDLEDCPSNKIPGFYERLTAWLPSLIEHRCSEGERGGFPAAPARRHLGRPHPRTRHPRIAEPGRHAHRLRQGAPDLHSRHLQGGGPLAPGTGRPAPASLPAATC
jgi:hypothetical protein